MKQVLNPFLPLDKYIPDGEPHVFGDRVYLYGSHDKEGGDRYCMLDYECFSAAVSDLTNWTCHGVIYKAVQCPHYSSSRQDMYAPDCIQGVDGRYYLYYCLNGFEGPISVAVCDTPAGKFKYYGDVKRKDGNPFLDFVPHDPGLLNDNGRIYLTCGWGLGHDLRNISKKLSNTYKMLFPHKTEASIDKYLTKCPLDAPIVELEADMLTIKSEPKVIFPSKTTAPLDTEVYNHSFYEAPSLRKFGGLYYFIYSSEKGHELCYATSKYPDHGYEYKGVLISNGDVGMKGRSEEEALAFLGTNHGSLECINGEYYIFYHRNTHNTLYSRQACAERVIMLADGTINQVEITSCGLSNKPLEAKGKYPAIICCNLTNGKLKYPKQLQHEKKIPQATHVFFDGQDRFIKDIENDTLIGYKYFEFMGEVELIVTMRGKAEGFLGIRDNEQILTSVHVKPSECWEKVSTKIAIEGICPLYFKFQGIGKFDLLELEFI